MGTIAWEPFFSNDLGMSHAAEVGIGANTLGLIFACLIGGPIARFLIQRRLHAARNDRRRPAIWKSVSAITSN